MDEAKMQRPSAGYARCSQTWNGPPCGPRSSRRNKALAYSGLVQSWPEIARRARERQQGSPAQAALFA